jgi:hypothetical protein
LTRLRSQPRHRRLGGKVVVGASAQGAVDQVPDAKKIQEAIGFDDLAVRQQRHVHRLLRRVEVAAEVPFALIGGVVAELLQPMPDRHDVRGHVALPGRLHVVEDPGVLSRAAPPPRMLRRDGSRDVSVPLVILASTAVERPED